MQVTHTFGEPLPFIMKLLNFALPTISFFLTTAGLEIDWRYVILAAGSALAGSLLFGYFRRERTFGAQLYKIAMATIAGLILGAYLVHVREYTAAPVISLTYCLSAMIALVVLRTAVILFEENSRKFTTTLIQRVFQIKLGDERAGKRPRSRRRGDVHISQPANSPTPVVEIPPDAKPGEVRVIEETIIETKTTK